MEIYDWLEEKLLHEISWEGMGTVKWDWLGLLVCTVICKVLKIRPTPQLPWQSWTYPPFQAVQNYTDLQKAKQPHRDKIWTTQSHYDLWI